jgi:hypothetical protein
VLPHERHLRFGQIKLGNWVPSPPSRLRNVVRVAAAFAEREIKIEQGQPMDNESSGTGLTQFS